ncbi:Ras association domain protein [Dictyocaulus viviparus]|uniref:Ras association domain protein n=1 Tax=Dictyocaulus viviparus TaxID=29172 RepID=A0A0D8Y080_DICVI|nr:Ras association domain protein [Dictyocaulus viviparus]
MLSFLFEFLQNYNLHRFISMKVLPTLQNRPVLSNMTIEDIGKNSDYAMLSEFSSAEVQKSDVKQDDDDVSVAGTVFNEPWDSNVWENLLDLASHGDESLSSERKQLTEGTQGDDSDSDRTIGGSMRMHESDDELDDELWTSMTTSARRTLPSDRVTCKAWEHDGVSNYGTMDSCFDDSFASTLQVKDDRHQQTSPHSMHSLPRANSQFSQQIGSLDDLPLSMPAFSPNLNYCRKAAQHESSVALQSCVERLAEDQSTVFGATLKRFIECTVQSEEADPNVVVRNVRQFINGIKNYLVKHGEERVKPHLYHVMVKENSRAGGLQALSANISYVRSLSLSDLGFSNADQLITPSVSAMEQIKNCLRKMQHHYSPLKKLENLLRHALFSSNLKLSASYYQLNQNTSTNKRCRGQLLLMGDAAYYLTALFSAIHILKNIDVIKKLAEKDENMVASMDLSRQLCSSTFSSASDAFVRVAIPDEVAGCIRYATFPGVPQMTTGRLCRVIAHQQGITNPEDHGLYLIVNGFESCLLPHECPDAIRDSLRVAGKPHLFAYKRHDAKIGWPRHVMSTPG